MREAGLNRSEQQTYEPIKLEYGIILSHSFLVGAVGSPPMNWGLGARVFDIPFVLTLFRFGIAVDVEAILEGGRVILVAFLFLYIISQTRIESSASSSWIEYEERLIRFKWQTRTCTISNIRVSCFPILAACVVALMLRLLLCRSSPTLLSRSTTSTASTECLSTLHPES